MIAVAMAFALVAGPASAASPQIISVEAAGFVLGTNHTTFDGTNTLDFELNQSPQVPLPFTQSAVKQDPGPARFGPDPKLPYFTVRFALPIPPENATTEVGTLVGLEAQVFTHNHSPGFEILPNGDALAVYFSTPPGKAEDDPTTSFIQARLRYGSAEWDLPERFFKTENYNDQSGLLWREGQKLWFFGGGRGLSDYVPFKMACSTDNGVSWTFTLPLLDQAATGYAAQPITSAFRGGDGAVYLAMDGKSASSFLWRSPDDGVHWRQQPGRTGARHSAIVPLDEHGDLLSIGGKNAAVNGWSPENTSTNWGASWNESTASPFPPLGSAQRPTLIRLADGSLFFVSDAYLHKIDRSPPKGWHFGNGCFVALSTNNGAFWRIKSLPVQLPNHGRGTNGTLGYVSARQAPNGVIHVLSTETQPCLHFELNEAWINSEAGDVAPETAGGEVRQFSENYPDGRVRSQWSARICPHGRYLLDGLETDYYPDGATQHTVTYADGRKTGEETLLAPDGKKRWVWFYDLEHNTAVWTQYWPNGEPRLVSNWNTKPEARDLKRSFFGLVADGPSSLYDLNGRLLRKVSFKNGVFDGEIPPEKP